MIQKRILVPTRVRRPPATGWSWVDRRFVREHAERLSREAMLLYFFLCAVADRQGLSFYSDGTLATLLRMTPLALAANNRQASAVALGTAGNLFANAHRRQLGILGQQGIDRRAVRVQQARTPGRITRGWLIQQQRLGHRVTRAVQASRHGPAREFLDLGQAADFGPQRHVHGNLPAALAGGCSANCRNNSPSCISPWPGSLRRRSTRGRESTCVNGRSEAIRSWANSSSRAAANRYSMPPQYVRKPVTIRASRDELRVLHEGQVVAQHVRSYERGQLIVQGDHRLAALTLRQRAGRSTLEQEFDSLGPEARQFHLHLKSRPVKIGVHLRRLLKLAQLYGRTEVLSAIAQALELTTYDAAYVENLLLAQRRRRQLPTPTLPAPKRRELIDEIEPEPSDPAVYDRLCHDTEDAPQPDPEEDSHGPT